MARTAARAALVAVALSLIVAVASGLKTQSPAQSSVQKGGRTARAGLITSRSSERKAKSGKSGKSGKKNGKAGGDSGGVQPAGACVICGDGAKGKGQSKPKITSLSFSWSGTDLTQEGKLN